MINKGDYNVVVTKKLGELEVITSTTEADYHVVVKKVGGAGSDHHRGRLRRSRTKKLVELEMITTEADYDDVAVIIIKLVELKVIKADYDDVVIIKLVELEVITAH